MPDPISGPLDLAFFAVGFIIMLWVAVDPRSLFAILNSYMHAKPPSDAEFRWLRITAGYCAVGIAVVLIAHLLRTR